MSKQPAMRQSPAKSGRAVAPKSRSAPLRRAARSVHALDYLRAHVAFWPGPESDIVWSVAPAGNLIVPRGFMAAGLIGSRIYVCGGNVPGEPNFDSVETFDIDTHASAEQPALKMPFGWGDMASAVSPTMPVLVLFGGDDHADRTYFCDTANTTWVKGFDLPVHISCHAGVAGPEGKGFYYAIGGNGFPVSDQISDAVHVLKKGFVGWTAAAPLPAPRFNHAAACANGRIYVFGGLGSEYELMDTVEEYDPATNSWTTLSATLPTPRYNLAAATGSNGRIYAIGGMRQCAASDVVEEFDPVAKTWRPLSPMPTARYGAAAVPTNDGRLFVIGGWRKVADKFYVTGVIEAATLPAF